MAEPGVPMGASVAIDIVSGWLVSEDGLYRYPIRNGIPRFVPESNYADSFGMQWNHFSKTQLDSHSGHPISAARFWKATAWSPDDMKDRWVLDVGCGSGRFAEVALSSGAQVVALDFSSAVDACYSNLKHHPNLSVVQGDIYALPFAPESFSFVYSLGVLQHTPDVARAFKALPQMVVGGGRLCVDYYEKSLRSWLLPKYWLRPFTRRMAKANLFNLLERFVPVLLPLSRALGRVPVFGSLLKRLVPVANYQGILPLSENQLREWALLDTFDWLSPTYDNPQNSTTARLWFEEAGFKEIEVIKAGHLVGRGSKPPIWPCGLGKNDRTAIITA
jgi:2-polyprenyl-3-methyl-5-hydroxy-6-metoxy-1,4-benzoquinol methylase